MKRFFEVLGYVILAGGAGGIAVYFVARDVDLRLVNEKADQLQTEVRRLQEADLRQLNRILIVEDEIDALKQGM